MLFLFVIYPAISQTASASSPSFARQEVSDDVNDWQLLSDPDSRHATYDINDCKVWNELSQSYEFPYADIELATYMSDGKILNATIWLSGANPEDQIFPNKTKDKLFGSKPTLELLDKQYGATMNVVSVFDRQGPDYTVSALYISDQQPSWKIATVERSDRTSRGLSLLNYTNRFESYDGIIPLSFSLSSANYPAFYSLIFYTIATYVNNNHLCYLADYTVATPVPAPKILISKQPVSLITRPGNESIVTVIVTSDTTDELQVKFDELKIPGIEAKFLPSLQTISNSKPGVSYLHIKVDSNLTESKTFHVPISANVSFPNVVYARFNTQFNNTKGQSIHINSNMTIAVLPPLTFFDHMGNFYNFLRTPINAIATFLGAIAAGLPFFIGIYRKNRKGK